MTTATKIDASNVMRVLGLGLGLYWLVSLPSLGVVLTARDKTELGALCVILLVAANWCACVALAMLLPSSAVAIFRKWKVNRVRAGAWFLWLILSLPGILWISWLAFEKLLEG